jgi:hypothetical protein
VTAPTVDASPLIDAIKAAVTSAGVAIAEGRKPASVGTRPYIVAFFDAGTVDDRSLRSRDGWSMYCSFQCAGLTPESARFAVRKLRDALLGLHLTVIGGRTVQMPVHEFPAPMTRDDDADPVLFIQIDEWRLRLA